jgi:hypothetical protein
MNNDNTTKSKRRIVHMSDELWDEAKHTAETLGLSTSQFLTRLVVETGGFDPAPNSLLGLPSAAGEPRANRNA